MAVNYGQVAIVPKGVWNAEAQYKVNNLVEYDGSSYVAKVQPPVGTLPTDTSYWQVSAAGTKKATPDSLGTVMPDGTTTEIKEDGKLSAKTAQQNALGVVKGSDDIIVGEDGNLTVNTTFEQATEIANIIAGEAIKSVLGKVSKAIATTMSLDENALLKNMISGIDVNDGSKVPSSAYIHSLVERIGMGTALEGGFDNLTAGLNSVNNNLSNGSVKSYFSPHKNNEADLCKGYNNSDGVFYFNYQGALVPIKKYVFSDGQGNGIFSSDQLVKNSDLPKNFKFLNLKYDTASSYDTEVLQYIESLKKAVFIIYCEHGSASMYMGFIVGDGKYGTVLRFEYDSLYVNGCSGNAWAGWTKLG